MTDPTRKADSDAPQPPAAPQPVKQGDPMDWPLPCDVKVGHGTMRKGVPLRTLVARMKALYEMATGENADKVANLTVDERQARMDTFRTALATAPAGVVGEPVAHMYPSDLERFRKLETIATAFSVAVSNPDERSVPLYTAPPARQALTDEQIDNLIPSSVLGGYTLADGKTHIDEVWTRNQVRAAVRACAESWGVKLVGIGGKEPTDS